MKWLDLLTRLVGPIIEAVRAIAGDDWDPDEAEARLKEILRQPPRQAVSDEDRRLLERIAEGD